jgi:hypothetical protein
LWKDEGWITGGAGEDLTIVKYFWDIINELLFLAYVDTEK